MTGTDLKNKAERFLNLQIKDSVALDGIQEALNWLGSMGYAIDTITYYDAEEDTFYGLPDELIEVIKIETTNDSGDKIYYNNYIIDGDMIRFGEEGDYVMFAKKKPKLEDIGDDLNVHTLIQYAVLSYLKGFILIKNDKDGSDYLQKFERDAVKAYRDLSKNKSGQNTVSVVRHA
jgi:hypothetical protein